MNEKCRKLNPTCRKKSVTSLIKWSLVSFPSTARPEALALAVMLFQLMVAGLPSSAAVLNSSPRIPPLCIFCMSLFVNAPNSDHQHVRSELRA